MTCFIIAEAGVNHNGSLKMALELVEQSAALGANAIKFQSFKADQLVTPDAHKAVYQEKMTGPGTQWEMLKQLELSVEQHDILFQHCKQHQIEFMSTPFDVESAQFLFSLGMQKFKIPSGEINNPQLLSTVARFHLPIIMSTGMANLEEVAVALKVIKHQNVTLLHCTSAYPTSDDDVHLRSMQTLASTFKLPVGYSDHTLGIHVAPLAVAMGASVIEKHITLDKALPGPDHQASLEPHEFAAMIQSIRQTEKCLGSPEKHARPCELANRDLVRRSITLVNFKQRGSRIEETDIHLLRPGNGISPMDLEKIIGKKVNRDLSAMTALKWEYLD